VIALKNSHKYILIAVVVGAFFFVPLMSVSGAATKELTESPFVKSEIKNVDYEEVSGTERVKNCTEVSIKIVLTNISKEIGTSKLIFYSELVGAEGHIEDTVLQSGSIYTLDHGAVGEEAVVSWSGEAPDVNRRGSFTVLNITQTAEGQYPVESIIRDVSSETAEEALKVWYKAKNVIEEVNQTLRNASEKGLNVASASTKFELAMELLNNSLGHYNMGMQDAALEEAKRALNHAEEAINLTKSAELSSGIKNYGILAVVVVVIVVVLVLILMQRKRKRGIY